MGTNLDGNEHKFTPLPFDILEAYTSETVSPHANKCVRVSLVSHNIMHAARESRLNSILLEYCSSMVVALQGTRRPQGDGKPLNCIRRQNFQIYSAGYTKAAGEHSGVLLEFNMRHMSSLDLKYYHIPTLPLIQGRLVGVRRKTRGTDEFHICVYFPPASHPKAQAMVSAL